MRYALATIALMALSQSAESQDKKIPGKPRELNTNTMKVGSVGVLDRVLDGKPSARRYVVVKILDGEEMIVKPKSNRGPDDRFIIRYDTMGIADGKELRFPGAYEVIRTKTNGRNTLYVLEKVAE